MILLLIDLNIQVGISNSPSIPNETASNNIMGSNRKPECRKNHIDDAKFKMVSQKSLKLYKTTHVRLIDKVQNSLYSYH